MQSDTVGLLTAEAAIQTNVKLYFMFTINIKGKPNPKDPKMVKLGMIIFKTGYARVTKVLSVSGIANVDVCHLTWDCLKEDKIIYERMKSPKQVKLTWYSARTSFFITRMGRSRLFSICCGRDGRQ